MNEDLLRQALRDHAEGTEVPADPAGLQRRLVAADHAARLAPWRWGALGAGLLVVLLVIGVLVGPGRSGGHTDEVHAGPPTLPPTSLADDPQGPGGGTSTTTATVAGAPTGTDVPATDPTTGEPVAPTTTTPAGDPGAPTTTVPGQLPGPTVPGQPTTTSLAFPFPTTTARPGATTTTTAAPATTTTTRPTTTTTTAPPACTTVSPSPATLPSTSRSITFAGGTAAASIRITSPYNAITNNVPVRTGAWSEGVSFNPVPRGTTFTVTFTCLNGAGAPVGTPATVAVTAV